MMREITKHYYRYGLFMAILGTGLFAMKSIIIKLAFQEGVDTVTLLTMRMLVATPFYLGVLIWLLTKKKHQTKPLPDSYALGKILALGFIGYYLSSLLDMEGLNYISAQLERLTLYTYPIITTLLAWFILKEALNRNILLALILTYFGIALIFAQEASGKTQETFYGIILVMASAVSYALYLVTSKNLIQRYGSQLFTSIVMIASTCYVLIHFFFMHDVSQLEGNYKIWSFAVLLGIFSTVIPSYLIAEAIARIGAGKTSIIGTLGPIFTIMIAVLFLGEPFGWIQIIGLVLVLGGVSLLKR